MKAAIRRKKQKKRVRRRKTIKRICGLVIMVGAICGSWHLLGRHNSEEKTESVINTGIKAVTSSHNLTEKNEYPKELKELLQKNSEAEDFVKNYMNREQYIEKDIDLSEEYIEGQVPLLMQWDRRWGYNSYGNDMIGIAGCGPTCLSMAYIYLTGDTSMNPREMAEFAYDNGYYTSVGTSWSLWTEGVEKLGLSGEELSLSEKLMKDSLDEGAVIICSMGPGDFTTQGHLILIRGYNKKGFLVNDPNRRSTSEKTWSFDDLSGQIKCLWEMEN